MIKHFLFLFSLLFLFWISQIIPETIVFKDETIRHVEIKSINTNTVVILNENGKLETIKKNIISRVVKKDKTGYKSELDKEHKESEQNFEVIKQKKVEEGKLNAGTKPSNESFATSNYFFSPSDKVVALAGPGATCETMSDKKQWFFLFGTFPINKLKSEEIFKEDGRYRIYLKPTTLDIVASIFLGIMTSVTVKTVYTETCQIESINVLNENEVNTLIGKKGEDPVLKTEETKSNQPNDNKPLQTIKEEKK